MGHTKLFNDVTDRRVLDKLIPIDSPHHIQMSQLMIDVISLVPDDDIDSLQSTPEPNFADFTGLDRCDESNHSARQNRRVGGYLYANCLLSGVWCHRY